MSSSTNYRLLQRLRRDLPRSTDYLSVKTPAETVISHRDFFTALNPGEDGVAPLLDKLIANGRMIKHDATSTVAQTTIGHRPVIIKRYNKRSALQRAKMLVAGTRAEKGFFKTMLLNRLAIPTPAPLLYCVSKEYAIPAVSYLVSVCSPGIPLCDLVDGERLTTAQWNLAISQAEEIIARLHAEGMTHGDIKTPNLLFDGQTVEIIDLDPLRVHRVRSLFERFRRKDLDRFATRVVAYPHRNGVK